MCIVVVKTLPGMNAVNHPFYLLPHWVLFLFLIFISVMARNDNLYFCSVFFLNQAVFSLAKIASAQDLEAVKDLSKNCQAQDKQGLRAYLK